MAIKRVYVVRRNPSLSHQQFAPRWRQHAELAQTFPDLVYQYPRLIYSCTVDHDTGIPGASRRYDGVGMLWLRSDDLVSVQPADPRVRPVMQKDELLVFQGKMLEAMLTVEEDVRKDGRGARFALISFLQAKPAVKPDEFARASQQYADAILAAPELETGIRRFTLGRVIGTPTVASDGVVEMWFDSVADAVRIANTAAFRTLVLDAQQGFALPAPLTLFTEIGHAWSAEDDPHPVPFP